MDDYINEERETTTKCKPDLFQSGLICDYLLLLYVLFMQQLKTHSANTSKLIYDLHL